MFSEAISFKVFFFHFCIMIPMGTRINEQLATNIWLIQDFSKNISIEILSKYLQLLGNKCHTNFSVLSPKMLQIKFGPNLPGVHRRVCRLKVLADDDRRRRRTTAFIISFPEAFGSGELKIFHKG